MNTSSTVEIGERTIGERTRPRVRWWTPSSTTLLRATASRFAGFPSGSERRAVARVGTDREGAVGHTRGACAPQPFLDRKRPLRINLLNQK